MVAERGSRSKSYLDKLLYSFICPNMECGIQFTQLLRSLVEADQVRCPRCGTVIDIRQSKGGGEIGQIIQEAISLDRAQTGG
jgi:hypothetical protein